MASRWQLLTDAASGLQRLEEQRMQLLALQIHLPPPQRAALTPILAELASTLAEQALRLASLQADGICDNAGSQSAALANLLRTPTRSRSSEVGSSGAVLSETKSVVDKLHNEVARLSLAATSIVGAVELALKNDKLLHHVESAALFGHDGCRPNAEIAPEVLFPSGLKSPRRTPSHGNHVLPSGVSAESLRHARRNGTSSVPSPRRTSYPSSSTQQGAVPLVQAPATARYPTPQHSTKRSVHGLLPEPSLPTANNKSYDTALLSSPLCSIPTATDALYTPTKCSTPSRSPRAPLPTWPSCSSQTVVESGCGVPPMRVMNGPSRQSSRNNSPPASPSPQNFYTRRASEDYDVGTSVAAPIQVNFCTQVSSEDKQIGSNVVKPVQVMNGPSRQSSRNNSPHASPSPQNFYTRRASEEYDIGTSAAAPIQVNLCTQVSSEDKHIGSNVVKPVQVSRDPQTRSEGHAEQDSKSCAPHLLRRNMVKIMNGPQRKRMSSAPADPSRAENRSCMTWTSPSSEVTRSPSGLWLRQDTASTASFASLAASATTIASSAVYQQHQPGANVALGQAKDSLSGRTLRAGPSRHSSPDGRISSELAACTLGTASPRSTQPNSNASLNASPPQANELRPGARVRVEGTRLEDQNGKLGVLLNFLMESQRWGVRLDDGQELQVRPECLIVQAPLHTGLQVGALLRVLEGQEFAVDGTQYYKEGDVGRILQVPTKDDAILRIEWPRTHVTTRFDTSNADWTTFFTLEAAPMRFANDVGGSLPSKQITLARGDHSCTDSRAVAKLDAQGSAATDLSASLRSLQQTPRRSMATSLMPEEYAAQHHAHQVVRRSTSPASAPAVRLSGSPTHAPVRRSQPALVSGDSLRGIGRHSDPAASADGNLDTTTPHSKSPLFAVRSAICNEMFGQGQENPRPSEPCSQQQSWQETQSVMWNAPHQQAFATTTPRRNLMRSHSSSSPHQCLLAQASDVAGVASPPQKNQVDVSPIRTVPCSPIHSPSVPTVGCNTRNFAVSIDGDYMADPKDWLDTLLCWTTKTLKPDQQHLLAIKRLATGEYMIDDRHVRLRWGSMKPGAAADVLVQEQGVHSDTEIPLQAYLARAASVASLNSERTCSPRFSAVQTQDTTVLPKNWTEHVDAQSGQKFYYNDVTGESTWERPKATTV